MKVYFFPGLGADAALAPFHPLPGHDVEWLEWPHGPFRDWPGFLDALQAGKALVAGSVFVGISFGGMAAQAMAMRVRPGAILLIGSCRSSREVAPIVRSVRPFLGLLPAPLFHPSLMPRTVASHFFGIRAREHLDLLYSMGLRLSPAATRALSRLALSFTSSVPEGLPVLSIHGEKDRMIPAGAAPRDSVIQEGGHLISLTHTEAVNAQLRSWIENLG